MKAVKFVGSALDDLGEFPRIARRDDGYQPRRVQNGLDPRDWKPMTNIGQGE
jgi:phage-related protein